MLGNSLPIKNAQLGNTSDFPEELKYTVYAVKVPELEGDPILQDLTIVEFSITDSLLAPSTQTTIRINDAIHTTPIRILDKYAGKKLQIQLFRPIFEILGFNAEMNLEHSVYRISDRSPVTNNIEKYNIHGCDHTLLVNTSKRISKSWECTPPSQVVNDILSMCIGAPLIDVEECGPSRHYIAENIHPFQAISQNADVALYGGNDPCFIHYMSLLNGGTHHFRSLVTLTQQTPKFKYTYGEQGANQSLANPFMIIQYEFPCDFDILSDLENGIALGDIEQTSFLSINPFSYVKNLMGQGKDSCGFGGSVYDYGFTNQSTGPEAGTCEVATEKYMPRRQARMALLDNDKIALKLVVPFNPNLFSGDMITAEFYNKNIDGTVEEDYGTGDYLITTITHTVKNNGIGVSIMDCVSKSVGLGRV